MSESGTASAQPPLSRSARRIRKSPSAAGTRIPAAIVRAFSQGVAVSAPASNARTIGAQLVDWTAMRDRKSTRLNSSHVEISYAVFCLKKKKKKEQVEK